MKETLNPFIAGNTEKTEESGIDSSNRHLQINREGISVSLSTLRKLQYFMPEVLDNKNIHVILD